MALDVTLDNTCGESSNDLISSNDSEKEPQDINDATQDQRLFVDTNIRSLATNALNQDLPEFAVDMTCDSTSDDERNHMVLSWIASLPESPAQTSYSCPSQEATAQGGMPSNAQGKQALEEEVSTSRVARMTKGLQDINIDRVDAPPFRHGIVPQRGQDTPPSPLFLTERAATPSRPIATRPGKKRRRGDTSSLSVAPSLKTRRREVPLPLRFARGYASDLPECYGWAYQPLYSDRSTAGHRPVPLTSWADLT
ncbi:hypothetical protein F4861DRAFT_541548 [Xylaria intraflava]|nr:hypothetical protein F4861DRAFT_541548 [Xylaria intraflava]